MTWSIEAVDGCAVVRMNTNKVNAQNDRFFADLHDAFDRLEQEFSELPVVLTGQGDVFSAGIDFQYSFEVFGSGSRDKIRDWYRAYRATNLRIFKYPRPTVAAVNGHAIAGGLITALDCDFRVAARKPAKFGLNEVPIGIPMPAAYVEIIKYTLGDQVGALATLRGKLYSLEEARRLGFFHEVVEPDKLLSTAIEYARCITPDCNTAYGGIGCFTPDNFPVFDRFRGNVYVIADSNHGYKMIGVGDLVADELLGTPRALLEPFRFSRYAAGTLHPVSNSPLPWS